MEDKELHDILKERIEKDYREQFNKGLMAGFDSCILTVYKQIEKLTSAKAIKKLMKEKVDDVNKRINNVDDEK